MKDTIIYIGGMELPDKNAAAQRVIANSKILEEIGYKVILAGLDRSLSDEKELKIISKPEIYNFDLYSKPYPNSILNWFRYTIEISWVKKLIQKYDKDRVYALIAYNYPALALLRLQKYAKKNNIKLISDCTEWYGTQNIPKAIDTTIRMRFAQKKVNNIICISDYLQNYYNNTNCNTINIPSLIDKLDEKWISYNDYKPSTQRVFSYVGSPGTTKEKDRLDMIIDGFYILKDKGYKFSFKIAGITKEGFLEMFPTYKSKLEHMNNEIVFLGRLSHLDSIKVVKESDYTIFARLENRVTMAGFPTKLAESFSCGTPVITNPTSNVVRFIERGKSGFVAKDCSVKALVEVLEEALSIDHETLIDMHKFCLEFNPLDYRNFIDDFKKFLERID